ncbi:Pka-R2, partial [Symbiodinium necroappetens]
PASVQAGQVVEMATIAYRYTFLDVLLEEEDRARELRGPDAGRARSAPASRGCRKAARDLEELEKHRYVLSLPKPEPKQSKAWGEEFSVGSVGHPNLCQRPCVHTAAGRRCEAGAGCEFCHLHHSHIMKMDKMQRRMIDEMPKGDFLYLVLQLLQEKARDASIQGTEALFDILEKELQSTQSEVHEIRKSPPRRLLRCLRQGSFAAVASLAARKCAKGSMIRVREAMQALRAQAQASEPTAQGSSN